MKPLYLGILFIAILGCASTQPEANDTGPFTGELSASQLLGDNPAFNSTYQTYQPSSADISAMRLLEGKSLMVLLGTWCHDSEREVPRLLKLLNLSGVQLAKLSLHGVNYNKQEPTNLHNQFNLRYTPTIILLDGDKEIGRIVEKPQISLAADLAAMLTN